MDSKGIEYKLPIWEIVQGLDYSKVNIIMNFLYTFFTLSINGEDFLELQPGFINTEVIIYAQDLFNMYVNVLANKQIFEVSYIGQAYGKEENRNAFDILAANLTL